MLKFILLSLSHEPTFSYHVNILRDSRLVGNLVETTSPEGFSRTLNGKTLFFDHSSNIFERTNVSCDFIRRLAPRKLFKPKIITLDIETLLINSTHVPMAVGIYTEKTGFNMFTDNNLVPTAIN